MSIDKEASRDLLRRDRAFDFKLKAKRQTWHQLRDAIRRDRQFAFVVKASGRKQED